MSNRTLRKSIFRDLRKSPGRFIAIFFIIAIGSGFFAGIGCAAPSMLYTADHFVDEARLADIRLVSTMGITEDDVRAVAALDSVEAAVPRYAFNAKVRHKNAINVFAIKSLPAVPSDDNPDYINRLTVTEGRLPEKIAECVVDERSGIPIGDFMIITDEIEGGDISMLKRTSLKVVGLITSPEYITFSRGKTTLGNGEIDSFIYLSPDCFDSEYYTEIDVILAGSTSITAFGKAYDKLIADRQTDMEKFGMERADIRYEQIMRDAEAELADAEAELADAKAELADAQGEIESAKEELQKAKDEANAKLADALASLNAGRQKYEDGLAEYDTNLTQIEAGEVQLAEAKATLAAIPPGIPPSMLPFDPAALAAQIAATEAQLAAGRQALEAAKTELDTAKEQLTEGQKTYEANRAKADREFADAQAKIDDGQAEIDDGQAEIDDGQAEIDKGRAELADVEKPEWLIFTRDDNPGFNGFKPNADRIATLAATVPPFMFLIAALVCLTTMTRLIEEQRTQIGTLKALGVRRGVILAKYMFYAIVVSFLGSLFGVVICVLMFPQSVWKAYGSMWELGDFMLLPVPLVCAIALFAGLFSTAVATFFACYNAQRSPAALLMRPRAPKAGKRVLLERAGPLWRRLTFNQKATMRNLFRYKKRLIMTIIGVAGCCALLLTGLGLEDSIGGIAARQYEEISHYDISVLLKNDADREALEPVLSESGSYFYISEEAGSADYKDLDTKDISASLFVPEDPLKMGEFITLIDEDTKKEFTLDVSESSTPRVVINEKLADLIGAKKGDLIHVTNTEDKVAAVRISAVCVSYIFNYIYMTPQDYRAAFLADVEYESILLKLDDTKAENKRNILTQIIATNGVEYAYSSDSVQAAINEISDNMTTVILLIRNMAGILAIVVLYNLININITEREREIATLKVLGYRRIEIFEYIFSESMILTAIGSLVGLFLGVGLHSYVMHAVETDDVSFVTSIRPLSFLLSVVFTMICCLIVNIIMQPKLQRIKPVSSLKSPE